MNNEDNSKKVIDVLNDLICINNDRIEGYEKASRELKEPVLERDRNMLLERAHESSIFRNELIATVNRLGGKPAENTTASGKIYRTWMDVKTAFTGGSVQSVYELCERGEDAALNAYDEALTDEIDWPLETYELVNRQRQMVKHAHDDIKRHRDALKMSK